MLNDSSAPFKSVQAPNDCDDRAPTHSFARPKICSEPTEAKEMSVQFSQWEANGMENEDHCEGNHIVQGSFARCEHPRPTCSFAKQRLCLSDFIHRRIERPVLASACS